MVRDVDATLRRKPFKSFLNGAILRTSSQIHREAYDLMVKENQFVLLRSTGNLPLSRLLEIPDISIVTTDPSLISQFRGYVLEVELSSDKRLERRYETTTAVDMAPSNPGTFGKLLNITSLQSEPKNSQRNSTSITSPQKTKSECNLICNFNSRVEKVEHLCLHSRQTLQILVKACATVKATAALHIAQSTSVIFWRPALTLHETRVVQKTTLRSHAPSSIQNTLKATSGVCLKMEAILLRFPLQSLLSLHLRT
jgi:hypothetical protein